MFKFFIIFFIWFFSTFSVRAHEYIPFISCEIQESIITKKDVPALQDEMYQAKYFSWFHQTQDYFFSELVVGKRTFSFYDQDNPYMNSFKMTVDKDHAYTLEISKTFTANKNRDSQFVTSSFKVTAEDCQVNRYSEENFKIECRVDSKPYSFEMVYDSMTDTQHIRSEGMLRLYALDEQSNKETSLTLNPLHCYSSN